MTALTLTEKLLKTAFIFSAVLLVSGLCMRLFCTYKISAASYDLADYKEKKDELEKEISSLVFKDCELSALVNVERRAYELGYNKLTEKILSINVKDIPQVAARTQ